MRKLPTEIDNVDLTKILVHYINNHPDKVSYENNSMITIIDDKVKFEFMQPYTAPSYISYYVKSPYKKNLTDWILQEGFNLDSQNCCDQLMDAWERRHEGEKLLFGCLSRIREEKIDSILENKIDKLLESDN